jgi:hypothetical protein
VALCHHGFAGAVVNPVGIEVSEELGDVAARSVREVLRFVIQAGIVCAAVAVDRSANSSELRRLNFMGLSLWSRIGSPARVVPAGLGLGSAAPWLAADGASLEFRRVKRRWCVPFRALGL